MYAAQQTSGYLGQSPVPNSYTQDSVGRAPELPAAMGQLEKTLCHLADLAERLDNRLTGVVARPQVPMPAETKAAGKQLMCTSVGTQLDAMSDRAMSAAMRLQSVLDRLEF